MNTQTVQDLLRKQEEKGMADWLRDDLRRLAQHVHDLKSDARLNSSERKVFAEFADYVERMKSDRREYSRNLEMGIGQTLYDAEQDERESANEPPLVY